MTDWKLIIDNIARYRNMNTQYSPMLCEFLITAEDHRFRFHPGFDIISLIRAAWKTIIHKKREGGSTVAMQLVRTITGDYRINLKRKVKEIYYAIKVSLFLEKDEILNNYLSVAYFGWNMHGIEQACKRLGFDINNLAKYEAASLIARLKYPEPRTPSKTKKELVKRRANHIINRHKKLESKHIYGAIFCTK